MTSLLSRLQQRSDVDGGHQEKSFSNADDYS
jgi:hypothetical protein